jgi:hypothetical protein
MSTMVRFFIIGTLAFLSSCQLVALDWAPRQANIERPSRSAADVRIVEVGQPTCVFAVMGTAFAGSLAGLAEVAGGVGGDGVYDTSCDVLVGQCSGRVYACKEPKHT